MNARYVLSVAVWHVPVLTICLVGFVLALIRPLPGRVRGLVLGGSALIGLATLACGRAGLTQVMTRPRSTQLFKSRGLPAP